MSPLISFARMTTAEFRNGTTSSTGLLQALLLRPRQLLLVTTAAGALFASSVAAQTTLPPANFAALSREHADALCVLLDGAAPTNQLSLVAWHRDAGLDLPTNQVIFVVNQEARLSLPAGTPFGDEGQPFWILPQSQNPALLYLGINVSRVPSGVVDGPIHIRLKRVEGPGYFMAWQATGPGQFHIRINSRDGLGADDAFMPLPGAHEHFNWGFSSTGIFALTFQASGRPLGGAGEISSAESTFVFQVLPLPPATNYATWQKHFWPPGFNPPTTLPDGNPDGDAFANVQEYAFGLSPTNANDWLQAPRFEWVNSESQTFAAITFSRYTPARDLLFEAQALTTFLLPWSTLSNVHDIVPRGDGLAEQVTIRDFLPLTDSSSRFLRLNTTLKSP